jgi:NAD(P)-dependent dehydrogenase (short-subunit alcohol dehydrogenase family)
MGAGPDEAIEQAAGDVRGKHIVITAGTGPVGQRAAGLLAKAGARVVITSRHADAGEKAAAAIERRFGARVRCVEMPDASHAAEALEGATILLNSGPAGVNLVPRRAWAGREGLTVAVDLNAVPPLGVEGVESQDDGATRDGVTVFGALGVGNLKMKLHRACIAKLFERNDLVLDAESIADVARDLVAASATASTSASAAKA